jgi:two-component system, NtrC family, sensor kinase
MKILLVDDSRSVAAVFSRRLAGFGHDVVWAENGAVAVDQFREQAPDLVLMDIEMPVMNGFAATDQIRRFEQSRQWAWTPIIFLTSVDSTDNFVTSIDAGGDDLISKNVAEPVLHAKLKAMARVATLRQELLHANRKMEEDIQARQLAEAALSERCSELTQLNLTLSQMQSQLVQAEKMASIGQLAAGVAHEINTPIAFVLSNLGTLGKYLETLIAALGSRESAASPGDLEYIVDDAPQLIRESKDGINRVRQIVQNLKDFSQIDTAQHWQLADLRHGLDATLSLLASQIEGKAEVVAQYGDLPLVECFPKQLNQVFVCLINNAVQAIGDDRGTLTIRSGADGDAVWIEFIDDGCGISDAIRAKIFDPFFTTRPVGKGAGLGLSLAYGIVQSHHGSIEVSSEVGRGSCFRVRLPLRQKNSVVSSENASA